MTSKQQLDEEATLATMQAAKDCVCLKCGDTGYLNEVPINGWFGYLAWQLAGVPADKIFWCDCKTGREKRANYDNHIDLYEQDRVDTLFQNAGIPERFRALTLSGIPTEFQKGKVDALNAAQYYSQHGHGITTTKAKREGLVLIGPPGVGKTGVLSVVFRSMIAKGKAGLWIELYQFFQEVQSEYSRPESMAAAKIQSAMEVPLLFLDDMGDPDRRNGGGIKEETDDKRSILWRIIDHRHGKGLPILGTSNLSRSDFERQWGTRLAARLWETCLVVSVGGVDLRKVL